MIQSILIPMDGSAAAYSALDNAAALARIAGAELRGFYVEDESEFMTGFGSVAPNSVLVGAGPSFLSPEVAKEIVSKWEETRQQLRTAFDRKLSDESLGGDFTVLRGVPAELIVEQAKTCDLTVLGRRGKHAEFAFSGPGVNVEALLLRTTRPVLVVPAGSKMSWRILIAYDGTPAAQRALDYGALFAKLQISQVDVLTVANKQEESAAPQHEAKRFLTPYKVDVTYVVRSGDPPRVIAQHAEAIGAGLIVMGAHGHSRLREIIFGCTTREVLETSKCPVLLVA